MEEIKEFIDENYFSLTIDCKREINEIYQAIEDYAKAKQLTLNDVGSMFYCNKEVIALDKQCDKQCKDCRKWVKDTF
jgi:RecG-like helicase